MHLLIPACNHQLTSNLSIFDHHSKTNPTKERQNQVKGQPNYQSNATQSNFPKRARMLRNHHRMSTARQSFSPAPVHSPFHSLTNIQTYTVPVCLPTTGVHVFTQTATCNYTSGARNAMQSNSSSQQQQGYRTQ
jgi:hypothetical protein